MKIFYTLPYILLCVAVALTGALLPACNGSDTRATRAVLAHVDTLLFADPDAALDTLATLPDTIADPATAAWRDLLTVKAHDKASREIIDETTAESAALYYDGKGDSLETQSRYYYGIALNLYKKYDQALVELYRAYNLVQNSKDIFFSAMCARAIANVYSKFYALDDELYWNDKSVELFRAANKPAHTAYAELSSIRTLTYIDPAKAKERFNNIDISYNQSDNYYNLLKYETLFEIYYNNKEYKNVIGLATAMLDNDYQLSANKWSKLSDAYMHIPDIKSAREALDSAITYQNTRQDSLTNDMMLSRYQYMTGDYRQAYRNNTNWAYGAMNTTQTLLTHPGTKQLTEYYILQNEISLKDQALKRLYLFLILIAAVLVIAILATITLKVLKSKKMQEIKYYEMQEKLDSLQNDLKKALQLQDKHLPNNTNNAIKSLLENYLNILQSLYQLPENLKQKNTAFENKLNHILTEITSDKALQNIEEIININDNNFMNEFRSHYPELPKSDYTIAVFLYFEFDTKTISLLMRKTEKAISSAKYNFRNRLEYYDRKCGNSHNNEFYKLILKKMHLTYKQL